MSIIAELNNQRPTEFSKKFVQDLEEKLRQYNDESSVVFDKLVDRLAKDMENTNEDIDIAEYDLKDFLIKNDAQLEEGETFDSIMEDRIIPTVQRRKLESDTLIKNSIKYMEDLDEKMSDISTNVVAFFREFATRMDANKEKLK